MEMVRKLTAVDEDKSLELYKACLDAVLDVGIDPLDAADVFYSLAKSMLVKLRVFYRIEEKSEDELAESVAELAFDLLKEFCGGEEG